MVKKIENISLPAINCVESINKSFKVLKVVEYLDHDGFNDDGLPLSDIWELFIYYEYDNIMYINVFHREDWFCFRGRDPKEEYRLVYDVEFESLKNKLNKSSFEKLILESY